MSILVDPDVLSGKKITDDIHAFKRLDFDADVSLNLFDVDAAAQFYKDPRAKFIITTAGKVLLCNEGAQRLLREGGFQKDAYSRLVFGPKKINDRAYKVLERLKAGRALEGHLIRRMPNNEWASLEFVKQANSHETKILVIFKEQSLCPDSSLRALSEGFDFTITETEVVRYMSEALTAKEISAKMDISINTVRAHLRSIYSKTGVRGYNRTLRLILKLMN